MPNKKDALILSPQKMLAVHIKFDEVVAFIDKMNGTTDPEKISAKLKNFTDNELFHAVKSVGSAQRKLDVLTVSLYKEVRRRTSEYGKESYKGKNPFLNSKGEPLSREEVFGLLGTTYEAANQAISRYDRKFGEGGSGSSGGPAKTLDLSKKLKVMFQYKTPDGVTHQWKFKMGTLEFVKQADIPAPEKKETGKGKGKGNAGVTVGQKGGTSTNGFYWQYSKADPPFGIHNTDVPRYGTAALVTCQNLQDANMKVSELDKAFKPLSQAAGA